jgi:hypothetical protein
VNILQSIAKVDGVLTTNIIAIAGDILESILGSYENVSERLQVEVK